MHCAGREQCLSCAHEKMLDKSWKLSIKFDIPRMKATNGIFELDANHCANLDLMVGKIQM
jgi:hypothetical protein